MAPQRNKKFQFSGHETFTLRQNWPYKMVAYCNDALSQGKFADFNDAYAVVPLGVGKNMVSSMKWWGLQCGFLENTEEGIVPTLFSNLVFGCNQSGPSQDLFTLLDGEPLDLYGESKVTAWVAHWNLCSAPNKFTCAWYLFNVYNDQFVTRDVLQKKVMEFAKSNGVSVTANTVKRDVEVLFRSYCPVVSKKDSSEDTVDNLFADLNLITLKGTSGFDISRSFKTSLPTPLFVWAVIDHWETLNKISASQTLDWFDIAFAPSSPGRVFKLNESDLSSRLEEFEKLTDGKIIWTDQLGIRNLICRTKDSNELRELKERMLVKAFRG